MTKTHIKIDAKNCEKIVQALAEINGRASAHVFEFYSQIAHLAEVAEKALAEFGVPKISRKGAMYTAESGEKLPSAYKYRAQTTSVVIERGASAWYLVKIERSELYPCQRPSAFLCLTSAQDEIAVAKLRGAYRLQAAVALKTETPTPQVTHENRI